MFTMNVHTKTRLLLIGKFLLIAAFAVSFQQYPLYSSNQNTYFLHGLAKAGVGFLNLDRLAQTADPVPVFSALVSLTVRVFNEHAFYVAYMLILAVYAYGIWGIASSVGGIGASRVTSLFFFALFTMWYSGFLVRLLVKFPESWRLVLAPLIAPHGLLTWGVAEQNILGTVFQPSTFGAFLVLSIYAFLRDKPFLAGVCLIVAAAFHPTYLLSAAVLTCTYMAVMILKDKAYLKALLLGTATFIAVVPLLIYIYVNFSSTRADFYARAQSILVDYRIPHHANVSNWFGPSAFFQIVVVVLCMYLVRRTKIFPVLLLPFLAATMLTTVQVLTGSKSLALLFPWRLSVFLVPIASAIILARAVSRGFQLFDNALSAIAGPLQAASLIVTFFLAYSGAAQTLEYLKIPRLGQNASTSFAAGTFQPGDLYLIPPEIQSFRLAARVPVFVDLKTHPYKDIEVVEWFNKVQITTKFYTSPEDTACDMLEGMAGQYHITHVILRKSGPSMTTCERLRLVWSDTDFGIYKIQRGQ